MRIAIDGTPAATQFAGVGRYTRELLKALLVQACRDRYQILSASDQHQADVLDAALPPGQWRTIRRLPVPERYLTAAWHRLRLPLPVDLLLQSFDVFHGPDFVLPPTRKPSVVTIHDLSYLLRPDLGEPSLISYLSAAVPQSLKRADAVIAVSASVAAELVDAYPFARHKVHAIPNGVAARSGRPRVGRPGADRPTILIVGTIEPRKNHLVLLDAMPEVWDQYPDAELVIAGRVGWQADAIVERLQKACATSAVRFVNQPTDSHLEELYASADVFAYPSLYEGFGLPVLEAMRHDVPVVASSIRALKETAGNAALYHEPDDCSALAFQIGRVLSDAELRAQLIAAGRQRVDRHSWDETARQTRRAYQAATEAHAHG